MSQMLILQTIKNEPGILQKTLTEKKIYDPWTFKTLLRNHLATREPIKLNRGISYKWFITQEGRDFLEQPQLTITI